MKFTLLLIFLFSTLFLKAQNFSFAVVADTHIGGNTASEDLLNTVNDINNITEIDFVIFAGDITEFGSESELLEAKSIIDKLSKPWYIVSGNHDSKWSESGNNDFKRIFGYECFYFEKEGIAFIGTSSGPVMRMAEGQVPREQILFLDSTLNTITDNKPIIFINHYPLDKSLANWYQIIDLLKTKNTRLSILGHGHTNKIFDFEGITGVMCRSNLRAKNSTGGYNIVSIKNNKIAFSERKIETAKEILPWFETEINREKTFDINKTFSRPDFSQNNDFPELSIKWQFQDISDIATGVSTNNKIAVSTNTAGIISALDIVNGNKIWEFKTSGKIFSTPTISKNYIVGASTDGNIYCLELSSGKLIWTFKTDKAIVASPIIEKNTIFIGSSEGIFRAIDLKTGTLKWSYDSINNFVETRPLIYKIGVYFGSWGNTFYCINKKTGKLLWKREKYNNRMFSPAAVWPVASNGKVFIVAPDRRMTALDAITGIEIWDSGTYSCRESIGISENKKIVFIKNVTEGKVLGFETSGNIQKLVWECDADLAYEIGPTPIIEKNGIVFVATTNGIVLAIDKEKKIVKWKYKISNSLINSIQTINNNELIITSFDGKVICLKY